MSEIGAFGTKQCRRCGEQKPLGFFPKDRSRPDGRWHTCCACNKAHWHEHGKRAAAQKKFREQMHRTTRQGMAGLRKYPHPGERFVSLPWGLRSVAEGLLHKYYQGHCSRMTPARYALLVACAASNAKRVGDRSWARRMLRLKGYRRAERRKMVQASGQTQRLARAEALVWGQYHTSQLEYLAVGAP